MADHVHDDAPPQVDFQTHARDWGRMIKMLKYGGIISFIVAIFVVILIAS
jgi:hypothetical protein